MTRYLEPIVRKTTPAVFRYNILDCHDAKIASYDTIEAAHAVVDFSADQCIAKIKTYK